MLGNLRERGNKDMRWRVERTGKSVVDVWRRKCLGTRKGAIW